MLSFGTIVIPGGGGIGGNGSAIENMVFPCEKIAELFGDAKFLEKYNEMTDPATFNLPHEKAYAVKYPAPNSGTTEPEYINADLPNCTPEANQTIVKEPMVYGLMHDHQNKDCNNGIPIKVPSPVDIKTFFNDLIPHAMTNTGSYGNAYSLITTSAGNYMMMYSGTAYPSKIEGPELQKLFQNYKKEFEYLYQDSYHVTQTDVEQTFLKFIKDKLNRSGLQIYKVTQNSATRLEYNTSYPNNIKPTPCQ